MPGALASPPGSQNINQSWQEEQKGAPPHLPEFFIQRRVKGEGSELGLSPFTESGFLLLGRIWAGEEHLVPL